MTLIRARGTRLLMAIACTGMAAAAAQCATATATVIPTDATGSATTQADLLIMHADTVIFGTVRSGAQSVAGTDGVPVDTLVPIAVTSTVKGAPAASLRLRVHGGAVADGDSLSLSSEAYPQPGDRDLLFLQRQDDGSYRPALGARSVIPSTLREDGNNSRPNPQYSTAPEQISADDVCSSGTSASPGYSGFNQSTNSYGNPLRWAVSRASFAVHSDATGFRSAIDAAASAWTGAGANFAVTDSGTLAANSGFVADGVNTVSAETHMDWSPLDTARTGVWSHADGSIIESDIVLNTAYNIQVDAPAGGSAIDAQSLLTHEFGHFIGLGHVSDSTEVMYPCLAYGQIRETLGYGDTHGALNLYPTDDYGYYLVKSNGAVYGLGGAGSWNHVNAPYYGGASAYIGYPTNTATDIAVHWPTRAGYWLLASNGGVFAYGDAPFKGAATGYVTGRAVAIAPTPSGNGYWVVATDGGVFNYGDAPFHGSAVGLFPSGAYATGIAGTADGNGYWVINNLGQVYAFGSAMYLGGGVPPTSQPARTIRADTSGHGYWILGADGGIFSFGDAPFRGSYPAAFAPRQLSRDPIGNSYAFIGADGTFYGFGVTSYGEATDCSPNGSCYSAIAVTQRPIPPSFSMTAAPSQMTVQQGSCGQSTIAMTANNTFYAYVNLSASGQPSGVGVSFNPWSVLLTENGAATSTVSVCPPRNTLQLTPYTFTLYVTGSGTNGTGASTQVNVTVMPAPLVP